MFQDSNDADSETSLFDRPDRKGSVDFSRTVRTTGSTYSLSNKAQNQTGAETKKEKITVNGGTNHDIKSERTKCQDDPPEIDTDEESNNLVGGIKKLTIESAPLKSQTNENKMESSVAATSSENIIGNSSTAPNPPSSYDITTSSSKLSEEQLAKQIGQTEYVACNGLGSSTGDSTASAKDNDLVSKAKDQASKDDTEANKSSIACGFTAAKLAKQEDFSPPLSPTSPSRSRVMSTLAPRYQGKSLECSVESCLSQFTVPEWLTGSNKFGCENCSKKLGMSVIIISPSSFILGRNSRSSFDEMVPGYFIPHELLGFVWIKIRVFGDGVWVAHSPPACYYVITQARVEYGKI